MATVTRENVSLLTDKLSVKVSKEDYFPSFEKALKQYAKVANIPGFRKGMVPTGVVKKMHGPAIFADEVIKSVEKGLSDFMVKEQLDIFAQPLPVDSDASKMNMDTPDEYTFNFEIGLKPNFEVDALKKSKLTRYKVTVTDEMVQNELERLVMRHGKMTEPEAVTSEDNVLNVKFEETDKDGNVIEGGVSGENSLLVKYFTKKYQKELQGKKKDDVVNLQLKKAFEEKELDWVLSDLKIKDVDGADEKYFNMTITKVGLVEKRELNEEFFKEVYPLKEIKTADEFKAALKEEIENHWAAQSRNHLHHELYHVLVDDTKMEFPETFLKKWLQTGGDKPKSAEEAEAEYPVFSNQLKWTLISDKLIKENNLEVNQEELRNYMKQQVMGYFGQMNLGENVEWLDSYVDRMMKDEQQVDSTYRRLITEKLFNWAETQITPVEKEISAEDFGKLQQEHEHHQH
ncbi:MAG: trigger factor [Sphingobacteriales bacterium]|nr:MAG: trigger factor [Sphingobacteriales bacterium]